MVKHQYKNLILDLPKNWVYEKEQGDIESCFDPNSKSTFRINVMQMKSPEDWSKETRIKSLVSAFASNLDYIVTSRGYFLTKIQLKETSDQGNKISLFSWRIIQLFDNGHANVAVLTYTILSNERDSKEEKDVITKLENSFAEATFV
ncbi:MAG: hypothetical protein WCS89_03490 [Candidatus Paceibacterota bacterium]|jgi:hypothetical protein